MSKKYLAFTLIELLVVIAIIGILSGLIVVTMSGMTNSANIAKAQVFSNSLRNSLMLNLVAEYKFDGPTNIDSTAVSADVTDTWGGYNGAVSGVPTVKGGKDCVFNKCLSFAANGDYIQVPSLSIPVNGPATVAGWFYFKDSAMARGSLIYLYHNFLYIAAAGGSDYFGWKPSLNTWYYLALTYAGDAHTAKLYVNTSPVNCTIQSGSQVPAFTNIISGGGANYFNGLIDEVRIYNNIVPASQIKEQYYAGLNNLLAKGKISSSEYRDNLREYSVSK